MLHKRLTREKQPHAQALAAAVMFEDQWKAEPLGRGRNVSAADDRERWRRLDIECRERVVLRDLGDFELEGALAVDDRAAMALEPGENAGGVFGGVAVVARVRGRAHAVVEHALRRRVAQIEHALIEEPLGIGKTARLELAPQRLDPGVVFVDDVDARLITGGNRIMTHDASLHARHVDISEGCRHF